jgi:hypothetical protein
MAVCGEMRYQVRARIDKIRTRRFYSHRTAHEEKQWPHPRLISATRKSKVSPKKWPHPYYLFSATRKSKVLPKSLTRARISYILHGDCAINAPPRGGDVGCDRQGL